MPNGIAGLKHYKIWSKPMNAESVFIQGSTHEVCEDYALEGENYTILSDGCSNGGGPRIHTDWGSRILCKAAEFHLGTAVEQPQSFMDVVGTTAQTQRNVFPNLPVESLTATLSGQQLVKEKIHSFLIGDGIIGGKRKDGRWKIHVIDFKKGGESNRSAPFYLKYQFCNDVEQYIKLFGGVYEVTTYFGVLHKPEMEYPANPPTDSEDWYAFQTDRQEQWAQVMTESTVEHSVTEKPCFAAQFPVDEYEFTFHCSDGAQSFRWYRASGTSRSKEDIHVLDSLRIALTFRPGPAFLRRATNWNFKTDRPGTFPRRGWFHEDDFSMGVIYCG